MNAEEIKKMLRDSKPHHEGSSLINEILIWLLIINGILYFLQLNNFVFLIIATISILLFFYVLFLFRNPERRIIPNEDAVFSPVDGKVSSVELVDNADFFADKRLKISFYTSPFQNHVKRAPVGGKAVNLMKEKGKYAEVVLETASGQQILIRHSGSFFNKLLYSFAEKGAYFEQGEEIGLLGSKLTLILPAHAEVIVRAGDIVRANESIIAR